MSIWSQINKSNLAHPLQYNLQDLANEIRNNPTNNINLDTMSVKPILLLHLNLQSIRNKLSELDIFLDEFPCHILCVNEHWLSKDEINLYIPANYKLATIYCRKTLSHGGVAIYVKSDITNYKILDVDNYSMDEVFEVTGILFSTIKLIVLSIYRTPDSDASVFITQWEKLTKYIERYKHYKVVYMGDININVLNDTPTKNVFCDTLRSLDYYYINDQPTRKKSCLDNAITNMQKPELACGTIEPYLSDHRGLWLTITVPRNDKITTKQISYRLLHETNIMLLRSKLNELDVHEVLNCSNVSEAWKLFVRNVSNRLNECCPRKVKTVNEGMSKQNNQVGS